jgi:uncharacterized membrane protein
MQEEAEATARRPDQKIDEVMGRVLQTGVILAASVVFTGGAIFLSRHQVPVTNYKVFQGEPAELRTLTGILHQAAELGGRGLIQLGLLLLIATPVARVAFSLLAFLWQRDWTYALVTVGVLGLLLYSLFGGYRGG